MRLSDHLKHLGFSSADAKRAMRSGRVRLHGIPTADAGREIQPFQVEVLTEGPKLTPGRDLVVVHRDALRRVRKPAGMLSVQAGKAGDTRTWSDSSASSPAVHSRSTASTKTHQD